MTLLDKSVRQQVLEKIQEKIEAIIPPNTSAPGYVPSDDDWPFQFSTVELGPLANEDNRKRYSVGIVPGPEKYSNLYPYIVNNHQIGIEFRVTKNQGDPEPQIMAEQCLSVLKRLVLKNKTWDNLVCDTQLVQSQIDLVSYSDRSIVGVLFIRVEYRHGQSDPRDPAPSF